MSTFDVAVVCGNCGHRWTISVARGTEVRGNYAGVWLHPDNCFGYPCKGSPVECPTCGREKEVSRDYREVKR